MRDTEYRVVSDLMYVIPVSSKIPMKLAAMLGGRGLSIYSAALTILDHVRSLLNNNTERYICTCMYSLQIEMRICISCGKSTPLFVRIIVAT